MSLQDKLRKMMQGKADKNKEKGAAFLAANALKEGVVTTESGLQYLIIKDAEGEKPAAHSRVTVHYKGTTLDGNEFDSSYRRNQPASFPLNQVIAGWTEGLQLMAPGAVYRFFIPHELAYGNRQVGSDIEPCSTLIFDVELLSF